MKINYQKAEFLTSWFGSLKMELPEKPEILFVGKSNVGKSSMINKILNRKSLARTSSTPGKTISVNYYGIDDSIYLVDLPGYGFAERSKSQKNDWGQLVDKYFALNRDVRIIFFLIDIRHDPTENDMIMYNYLMSEQNLFSVVATKADKLKKKQLEKRVKELSDIFNLNVIPFSAENGLGTDELKKIIEDVSEGQKDITDDD